VAALYGLMAEFETPEDILEACRKAYSNGYRQMEAYSPFPVDGLNDAIGYHRNDVALIVLLGGICGCVGGYLLQVWAMVWSYPLNIGGRPLNSWPAFIPVTFELTILCAGLSAVFGMLALNGLPMPYHPVFNVERFELASRSRFFLCIQGRDPQFELDRTRQFLQSLKAKGVHDVAP
jgi:hypothetical protein